MHSFTLVHQLVRIYLLIWHHPSKSVIWQCLNYFLLLNFKRLPNQYQDGGVLLQDSFRYRNTRSLGALQAPTSSWRPVRPLDIVLRALRALRPCDPRVGDWIVC